ncbi:MAG: peptidylprolyl isomerase, partial [Spirochaetaceae bacterium]|nr:peptidylprolyl isomerase [Spirochaetaceae bacterium]
MGNHRNKVSFLFFALLFIGFIMSTSCSNSYEDLPNGLYAEIKTNRGRILLNLEYEKTPLTVCNFVALAEGNMNTQAKEGPFYDGLKFHRVIDDFMIQGGDPLGTGSGGPGYHFADEIDSSLSFDGPGILAMANAGPGTNGSQFFITHVETPWLNGKHTIFGHVVEGQSVVDSIRQDDEIQKVTIIRRGANAEAFKADQATFDNLIAANQQKAAQEREEAQQSVIQEIENKWPQAQTDDNGIRYIIKTEGTGPKPEAGITITANYRGSFLDGRVFDSSFDRGEPIEFVLGRGNVIPGWDIALQDMRKGENRLIIIPPELAYGERGAGGGVIPQN